MKDTVMFPPVKEKGRALNHKKGHFSFANKQLEQAN